MDRRRAAGALLALAACIATTAAAPTASNHTELDLYDEHTEGCYYNFQHYGEGDRIMTNEPCLNCTCHNRMLMCYLRVCPFTKAIGQDCTVEKRADQCCPIVTCPDVPVDLLTSTSTSSPAEYGGTGVGKVDNYGCTLNGKYFPEGSKVPSSPNKPCEHCYCIRNMTTCVMQECTLHVDGCTPIYHKDVCCPVRYFCDHPEDEIPLLDDMTTTVRPTPGFLLTTIAPTEITTTPPPAKKDCIENGQMYEDGALIKTEKPCEHCYCMKGDIVCVVQECGTPMENEGKNCTSVPPREGHCCPDTYICEGDELSPEPTTEMPFEESTTMAPSRRVSVEGSGYRNDDEITLMPTFATEIEGSGEEEMPERPLSTRQPDVDTTELDERLGPTEQGEFIPKTTQAPITDKTEKLTTEPDKDLNTVPSDGESTESPVKEKTTLPDLPKTTESEVGEEISTPSVIEKVEPSEPTATEKVATSESEMVPTESTLSQEQSTLEPKTTASSIAESTPKPKERVTEVHEAELPITTSKPSIAEETEMSTVSDGIKATEQPTSAEQEQVTTIPTEKVHEESSEPSVFTTSPSEEFKTTTSPTVTDKEIDETDLKETRRTSAKDEDSTEKMPAVEQETTPSEIKEEIRTEPTVLESTTSRDKLDVTEPASISDQYTVPGSTTPDESTKPSDETAVTQQEPVTSAIPEEESSEPSTVEKTTVRSDLETTKLTIADEEQPSKTDSPLDVTKGEEEGVTTELTLRQEDESTTAAESATQRGTDTPTTTEMDVTKEIVTPGKDISSTEAPITHPAEQELELTTALVPEQQEPEKSTQMKDITTESIMELSTFAHIDDKETSSSVAPEKEIVPTTSATEKQDLPEATTINPEDNEIDEEQSPGRIPGEGDCLLEGITYKNESVVPSSNKCHTGCKCISSIIKCDPIICSPQPEYMDNCQLRYDTPESCCPTYVCDHRKETIPPQPHSQMSGTESPMQSTAVECNGDQCGVTESQQPTTEQSKTPERIGETDCGSNDCGNTQLSPPEGCVSGECTQPAESCTDGKCELPLQPTKEQPPEIPSKDISESCTNPEDCKATHVPTPCEGESCITVPVQACDKEGGCETPTVLPCEGENCKIEPGLAPDTIIPDKESSACENQEDCKQIKEVQPSCEGASCPIAPESTTVKVEPQICQNEEECKRIEIPVTATEVKEDCSNGDCKITTSPPSQEDLCAGQADCKIPDKTSTDCKEGICGEKQGEDKIVPECNGDQCMQQEPMSPTQAPAYSESLSTESQRTTFPEPTTTLSAETVTLEPVVTGEPDKKVPEHEIPVVTEEDKVTKDSIDEFTTLVPDLVGSDQPDKKEEITTEASATKPAQENITTTPKSDIDESISTDRAELPVTKETDTMPISTEIPQQVTESEEKQTEKPTEPSDEVKETSTKLPEEHYETTTEITKTEDTRKEPEVPEVEENHSTTVSGIPVTDYEKPTQKPIEEEPVETSTPEILRIETTEKSTESPVKVTEPPIYETTEAETKQPDIAVETEEIATKSPSDYETTIPSDKIPDQETPTVEQEKTESPTVEVTTSHEILITPKTTEKVPSELPERFGDSAETTVIPELDQAVTKGSEILDTTETITQKSEVDNYTTENIPTEVKVSHPHITEPDTETVTKVPLTTTQSTGELDTIAPETATSIEDKISTISPMPHVTEKEQTEVTTIQVPGSEYVTQSESVTTEQPELHEPERVGTELPLPTSYEPEKIVTEAPYSLITEQDTATEKDTAIMPEKKPEDTDKQTSTPTVAVHDITTEQQEISTKSPMVTEVSSPAEDKATESSYDTESPFVQPHEETTSAPTMQPTSEKEITEVTDMKQPSVTEEYEISTEKPKPSDDENYTHTKQPEIVTVATDVYNTEIPTVISQTEEDGKLTTKPDQDIVVDSGDRVTETPEGPKFETEVPSSPTEGHDITEPTIIEMDTTRSPESGISEDKLTTTSPIELSTKEIIREEPETTKLEEPITDAPKTSTQTPIQETDEQHTVKEEPAATITSEVPTLETHTELPVAVETSEPDKLLIVTTERSEIPTTDHKYKEPEEFDNKTEPSQEKTTEKSETEPGIVDTKIQDSTESVPIETTVSPLEISTEMHVPESTEDKEIAPQDISTPKPEIEHSETTPYLVELEEHTHKIDEELSTTSPSEELTTSRVEQETEEPQETSGPTESITSDEKQTQMPPVDRDTPEKEESSPSTEGPQTTRLSTEEAPEKTTEAALSDSETTPGVVPEHDKEQESTTLTQISEEPTTSAPSVEKEKPVEESQTEKDTAEKPHDIPVETTAPEEEFIPVTTATKITTAKVEEETTTQSAGIPDKFTKPEEKPSESIPSTSSPEISKPDELPPTDEALPPEEESHFPPSGMGGYGGNQEPDYGDEDQAFGPGTCRYGGKVYVSAQQIPRDDPCDFCFCFRSDIICLQQSCPPPIHGCHEEPIQGFCCPRYECPVSMATTLNVTTTTTTTTTTLPPHFLPHAYKGAAQRRGCQIKGHTYKVGEVVRASSGPCLHCTCGGDGQMKCDPKACTPEPMLRQMIAAAVSAKRRR